METCIMCGEIIPEGRQVCPICEERCNYSTTDLLNIKNLIPLTCVIGVAVICLCTIVSWIA